MKNFINKNFFLLIFSEGIIVLLLFLRQRSEPQNAVLWGYSIVRLGLICLLLLFLILILWLHIKIIRAGNLFTNKSKLGRWLTSQNNLFWTSASLIFCMFLALLAFIFTYLFIPPPARSLIVFLFLILLQFYLCLRLFFSDQYHQKSFYEPLAPLPRLSRLEPQQKKVLIILILIGLVYFLAFIIPNLLIDKDDTSLIHNLDEIVTYTYVVWMLSPADDIYEAVYTWFIYEDYHYGYPFYFLSALVLLPVRLIFGANFQDHLPLNLLLLRQFISVLPMIISFILLVYLQTRFKSTLRSIGLFLLLLFIPTVIAYNIRFWHPDALVVLSVVLVLFFLDADRMRFGINFFLAAAACGLAAAIKLYGFFFFLTILAYLIAGLVTKRFDLKKAILYGSSFILIMSVVILLVNPFLFMSQPRTTMISTIQEKRGEMVSGYYGNATGEAYSIDPLGSLLFLEGGYGSLIFLAFLLLSLIACSIWEKDQYINRLILTWIIPLSIYLLFFSAYKSYHYWLPALIPLYSCYFCVLHFYEDHLSENEIPCKIKPIISKTLNVILWVAIVFKMTNNIQLSHIDWQNWLRWKDIFWVRW